MLQDVLDNGVSLFIPGGSSIELLFKYSAEGTVKKNIWNILEANPDLRPPGVNVIEILDLSTV